MVNNIVGDTFREIFIFVAGATPQIITETIYALARKKPPVNPDEIYIITTSTGKSCIEDTLIKKGILQALQEEYNLPRVGLKEESFILVKDPTGGELEDIRNEAENEALGDLITSLIQEKAKDGLARLHCSLAGGRKTMSFYIGSSLQLFGRPWDRLYHVLVSPEFETNPNFFYKPKKNVIIERVLEKRDRTVSKLNTDDAEIQLAELPLIRLGSKLALRGKGFRELVSEGQQELDIATMQPELSVNLYERTIYVGSTLIEMVPMQLMIYASFLRQKVEHCKWLERPYCQECTDCFLSFADLSNRQSLDVMASDYKRLYRDQPFRAEELIDKWEGGMDVKVLMTYRSKINRTFQEDLGDRRLLSYYRIDKIGKYAGSRYGVRVEKKKIRLEI